MTKTQAINGFLQCFFGAPDPERFAFIDRSSRLLSAGRRQLLFSEGETGSTFFFLAHGRVKLFRSTADGKEAVIRFIEPGEYFAEILLQLKRRYPVSAVTLEESILLAIDAEQILSHLQQHPDAALQFIGALSQRIKYLLGMIEQLTLSDIRQRFINYLLALDQRQSGGAVRLPAPKGEIALLLGTTPETFSRLLGRLGQEGLIAVEGRSIRLLADFPREQNRESASCAI